MSSPSAPSEKRRGRLSIYTGPVPGVGKTRRMLEDAARMREGGGDVVVALADARGRAEVEALAAGFERVAGRPVEYHGVGASELDVDAVIARRPAIALVDDLAHANPPGSRHPRRHQDVDDLRAAGIDVLATVGIEHLDSLNELVLRLTGVTVSGTIPDAAFQSADSVVHVDASLEELQQRLDTGRLYPPEKRAWALQGYLRPDALLAMRELSLRQTAEALARRQAHETASLAPEVSERVLVGLSSFSPKAMALLRRGSRLAGRLNTHWFVVYVETPAEAPGRLTADIRHHLASCVEKARELGAEVHFVRSAAPVRALVDFARAHGVAHIVVGRSRRPWWQETFGRSMIAQLAREAAGFDLHVLSMDEP
jgi:two-component system, OmpR family, sensor histidine kinase KdpD